MRSIWKNDEGTAVVEMTLVAPFLLLLTFSIVQFGLIFLSLSMMERTVHKAARDLSVREADDETNGILTSCNSLTGMSPSGGISVEQIACNLLSHLPGTYSVSASDSVSSGIAGPGKPVTVTVSVSKGDILFADFFGYFSKNGVFRRSALGRME